MTVQEVYDLYLRFKKDLSNVSDELFFDWCDEVNRFAYRVVYAHTPDTLATETTINIVTSTASYALPADFLNIDPLGTGLFKVYGGITSSDMYFKTGFGSIDTGYYIKDGFIVFTPIPQASATAVLRYIPSLSRIDSFEDSMVIPDEFIYYVRDAIDCLYDVWDEDVSSEGLADARFVRKLDELARNLRKDASTVGIYTYNNAFRG